MMMTLGMFVFALDTAPYQELQRQTSWRHSAQNRVGRKPVRQFLGEGEDTISLSGVLYPGFTGGQKNLDQLRNMAAEGSAWPLIEGTGRNYGLFAIESMSERKTHATGDGAAQKIEFDLTLVAIDEARPDRLGEMNSSITRQMMGLVA